ncbi:MAG: hypothetical protein U1E73_03035 [Planctomycetota bacterium]
MIHRVFRGPLADLPDGPEGWRLFLANYRDLPQRPDDPLMDELLDEALSKSPQVRAAARVALETLAAIGLDVSEPLFAEHDIEHRLPDHGSVGMHLLGFPEILAREPYREQAERLFQRCADLRERIPHYDPRWPGDLEAATTRFRERGDLPESDLLLDAVLALGELHHLFEQAAGNGDAEALAIFDAAAQGNCPSRQAAVARLAEMARSGRFALPCTARRRGTEAVPW